MTEPTRQQPGFDLWTAPWITLERPAGGMERVGIEQALLRAHEYRAIFEPSPLAVVGIHRLLTAVLQDALHLACRADVLDTWRAGIVPDQPVKQFAKQYGDRFDLFSTDMPFLQSADLPLTPDHAEAKSVAYLAPETPAGTNATHFCHGGESGQAFCPACAAACLVTIPAFATSGGQGIKPSINGVPPIYVIPGGASLFHSLVASLLLPDYQPKVASRQVDLAWWNRPPVVARGSEVLDVGYLHSLTFAARRVRLHPLRLDGICTRCGRGLEWGVRTMAFEMGECRPRDAPSWFDPFCAYRLRARDSTKPPTPIRPSAGKAAWREFASLFLQGSSDEDRERTLRPSVLDQIAWLELGGSDWIFPFRCVGLRTDMKAKVFEWVDSSLDVPAALLKDERAGVRVEDALQFAGQCGASIRSVFRATFGGSGKSKRNEAVAARMLDQFWTALADPFRIFIVGLASSGAESRAGDLRRWVDTVLRQGGRCFREASATLGDDAASLRRRVEGERHCAFALAKLLHEFCSSQGWEGTHVGQ